MKNLIYQFWTGDMPPYAKMGQKLVKAYASKAGAEYRFDRNPGFFKGKRARYYHCLRPVFDQSFHEFDRVLFLDMDIFPVQSADPGIFELDLADIAMAAERLQPELRETVAGRVNARNDRRWQWICEKFFGSNIPTDQKGRPLVYNSGVILFSKQGMAKAHKTFSNIRTYIATMKILRLCEFYRLDQNYLGCNAFRKGIEFTELSQVWNSQIHIFEDVQGTQKLIDRRSADTNFIHFQLPEKREMSETQIKDVLQF